jgi:DNA-binding transcriptional LysR family regulator
MRNCCEMESIACLFIKE